VAVATPPPPWPVAYATATPPPLWPWLRHRHRGHAVAPPLWLIHSGRVALWRRLWRWLRHATLAKPKWRGVATATAATAPHWQSQSGGCGYATATVTRLEPPWPVALWRLWPWGCHGYFNKVKITWRSHRHSRHSATRPQRVFFGSVLALLFCCASLFFVVILLMLDYLKIPSQHPYPPYARKSG